MLESANYLHIENVRQSAVAASSQAGEGEPGATIEPMPLPPLRERPLVSVLCSNYNYGKFVGGAIESVLQQTYPHFELIVCDDGSTDDSCSVIESYAKRDRRVTLIRKVNGGQSSGYNAAYAASAGEVICLIDADDVYYPNKLARLVEHFRTFPDFGFVGHLLVRVDEQRKREGITPMLGRMPSGWQARRTLANAGILEYIAPGGGLSVRREVAERIFPLPENGPMRNCGDSPFMLLAPLMTPLVAVHEPLAEWRRHDRNRSNRAQIDAAFIARELGVLEHQWRFQHDYLARYHPGAVNALAPLDTSYHVTSLRYCLTRLRSGGAVFAQYRMLLQRAKELGQRLRAARKTSSPTQESLPRLLPLALWIVFWAISILLPRPLFRAAYNFMVTPGWIKEFLRRA